MDSGIPERLTSTEVVRFIQENEQLDEKAFLLKHPTYLGLPSTLLAEQIQGRRKAKTKLPSWFHKQGIIYPPLVSLEQCSSERTAQYKCERIRHFTGYQITGRAVDLTGGFGVDSYFISKIFSSVDYVEPDLRLLEISRHNHRCLGATNIFYHHSTAEDFLLSDNGPYNLILADPSRKSAHRSKIVKLQDCRPDVIKLQRHIYERSDLFVLKASPLHDIKEALRQLGYITEVNAVAVNNEMRELLFMGLKSHKDEPVIRAVNLGDEGIEEFCFTFKEEEQAISHFSGPLTFLYEPNRAILKAGAFRLISMRFGLHKLHPNTHLYTSHHEVPDFPGRIFKVKQDVSSARQNDSFHFSQKQANIIIRNYPATVATLTKKLKITEGGTEYLIACTSVEKKHLLLAERLK
ncbi:MAG: class I SAM-dependent methyltransferase [Cyclobacteriaceae bacterium]|nr:class I SAM-dependent methyltransferase [Cyclobacteriaceae bacterium]MDW8330755.1 hypothetical protein [Cyclobacteriaceae bacterium]